MLEASDERSSDLAFTVTVAGALVHGSIDSEPDDDRDKSNADVTLATDATYAQQADTEV